MQGWIISSLLMNCKSERKFADLLNLEFPTEYRNVQKKFLTSNPCDNYKYWTKSVNGKEREFFECKPHTKRLHKRLNQLMNITDRTVPSYLMSGYKGSSYLHNAQYHEGQNFFLLIDIKGFYPSITKDKIKSSLRLQYNQSNDISEFISNLVTVEQVKSTQRALPTGSTLSQNMAFFVNRKMFDDLFSLANAHNIRMSVYVDDISFSSKATIPYSFVSSVMHIVKKYGYEIAKNKMNYGRLKPINNNEEAKSRMDITGVQLTKYGSFLTASRKNRIKKKRDLIIQKKINLEPYDEELYSLNSSMSQAYLINKKYKRYMKQFNQRLENDDFKNCIKN